MNFRYLTSRDATTQQAHLLEVSIRINLDSTGRIKHRILGESRCVEKMEYGLSIHGRKPTLSIIFHHTLERVDAISLAEIGRVVCAVGAVAAFSIEDRNHMVACFKVRDTFTYTLNQPAKRIQVSLKW